MEVRRGDIFYVEGRKKEGSEQYPNRPAVIVSNNKCNEHSSVVEVVFLTTAAKNPLPTHVEVMCQVPSTALCEQVHSINKDKLVEYMRSCTSEEMRRIDEALMISLDIVDPSLNPVTDERLEELEEELRCKREYINGLEETNAELVEENDRLKKAGAEIKYVIDEGKVTKLGESEELISLRAERNLYKAQYEALLERLLGK